jgi:beta-galactosidase
MTRFHRRQILASATALALAGGAVSRAQAQTAAATDGPRQRLRLDEGWRFAFGHLDDETKDFNFGKDQRTYAKQGPDSGDAAQAKFDDSAWRLIDLPHDWAVELPFVHKDVALVPDDHGIVWDNAANHGYKPLGRDYPETSIGWYRKTFTLDPADVGRRISLEFDGVFRACIVMVNGYIVRSHEGGYTTFAIDITDFLNTDASPNVIAVRVDASLGEGWFYEGAGIYRHVWLYKNGPVHIVKNGVHIQANAKGGLSVQTRVNNESDHDVEISIRHSVPGRVLDTTVMTLPAHTVASPLLVGGVMNPRLWSLEDPQLYQLETVVADNKLLKAGAPDDHAILDRMVTSFGFRDIKFDADQGFFLNGKSVKIKGTCNHQDHAGVGSAVPDALWDYRLQCLKDMGCNAIRTSHNPPAPELLDACDRMGVLVIDETRMMTSSERGLEDLRAMVVRDRNHPSIILWSIGNEEPQQGTARGATIARTMKRIVNELDPTRGITAAMDNGWGEGITEVVDVIGFNYRDNKIDDFHAKFPKIPIIGTETASTVATRGEYVTDDARHTLRAYDTEAPWWAATAEAWWPHFDAKPYIGGGFIWTGFDYRGEPTPYSTWPSISSQFGAMDTCGFPKDNYYYYRAWWRPEPLLHLFPHWNWEGKEGQTIPVWAYSNCDEVELFVNGRSAGRKPMAKDMHVEWQVAYAPGKIEAYGYKAGKVVLKDVRETAGPAAKIVLSADRAGLTADGRDCAVIRAEVVDARGHAVPKAGNLITFTVTGPAAVIGVGNGDPNCHEPDKASKRSAFNGLCCAIVQTQKAVGAIAVSASADGLVSGKVVVKSA